MLRIINCMYEKVKSCVKSCIIFFRYFCVFCPLKARGSNFAWFVSLFLEDLELYFQNRAELGLLIDDIVLIAFFFFFFFFFFADDMVFLSKSPEELQYHLDLLHTYCSNWGLEVNAEKTKKYGPSCSKRR